MWNAKVGTHEERKCEHADITRITQDAFRSFYAAIGETCPSFPSDRRLKNVGKEFTSGLEKLKNLIYITILTKQIRIKHHM